MPPGRRPFLRLGFCGVVPDFLTGSGLAPAGEVLSFASPSDRRPKANTQRKGDPSVCVPALCFGQTACRRRSQAGGSGQPARLVAKSGSSAYMNCGGSYQIYLGAILSPVLPLVPTSRRRSRRDVGSRGQLFAHFLAQESRSSAGAKSRSLS